MNSLIDELVADLKPVKAVTPTALARRLGIALLASLLLVTAGIGLRPDWAEALLTPVMWWNIGCTGLVGLSGAAMLYVAALPGRPAPRWPVAGLLAGAGLALATAITYLASDPAEALSHARGPMDGLRCGAWILLASVPPLLACLAFIRRSAPVRPARAALLTGLVSGSFGALAFALHCPEDTPLHVAAWHVLAIGVLAVSARALLTRWLRW